jgi:hypothetical protein
VRRPTKPASDVLRPPAARVDAAPRALDPIGRDNGRDMLSSPSRRVRARGLSHRISCAARPGRSRDPGIPRAGGAGVCRGGLHSTALIWSRRWAPTVSRARLGRADLVAPRVRGERGRDGKMAVTSSSAGASAIGCTVSRAGVRERVVAAASEACHGGSFGRGLAELRLAGCTPPERRVQAKVWAALPIS